MSTVKFTRALKRFFPSLEPIEIQGQSISEVIDQVEKIHPGIRDYILDNQGQVRKHVNVFVDGVMIADRETLSDTVESNSEIYIMQALSGG